MNARTADGLLDEARKLPPRLVRREGELEYWAAGEVLFTLLALRDDWPAAVKSAVSRRLQAMLTGRCECGGTQSPARDRAPGVLRAQFEHIEGCPATDASLRLLLAGVGGLS